MPAIAPATEDGEDFEDTFKNSMLAAFSAALRLQIMFWLHSVFYLLNRRRRSFSHIVVAFGKSKLISLGVLGQKGRIQKAL
jgi:hypothetical protein